MEVEVQFEGQSFILTYNAQTGYFEGNLIAPSEGGVKNITVNAVDALGQSVTDTYKIRVLKKQDEIITLKEQLVYFLDKKTFKIKDIVKYEKYNICIDEETNAKTTFEIMKKNNIANKDFVFIKRNNNIDYIGIIDDIVNENGEIKQSITCKYISNIFDRKIILKNESLISSTGIEDFILYTIQNQFTQSDDSLLNFDFLDVEILTHTPIQKSVDTENNIYNFHTFITNCTQNYNIVLDFKYENKRLKLSVYKQESEVRKIDTTLSDVCNYTEVFEKDVTAKVTVLCEDSSEHSWYLLADRTTTDNKNDENRADGLIETVYTPNVEDARQTALDIFKANSYKHMITFNLKRETKLFDIKNLKIGTKINIKTNNNIVLDTYISAIEDNGGAFVKYTTGNMRINFIDKLKKERRA